MEKDEWVNRLKSSENVRNEAITELGDILLRALRATLRDQSNSRIQAEDVVQEALMKVLAKLDSFQGRSKFTTWAIKIAIRIAFGEMRRRSFKDVSLESLVGDGMRFDPEGAPKSTGFEIEKNEFLEKLGRLIETELTDKQRITIHALLQQMPIEVIAEKTGSNSNAVYKLVHDARIRLRHGLEQAGYKAEDFGGDFAETMMSLSKEQILMLLSMVATAQPGTIPCDDCIDQIDEYSEVDPESQDLPKNMQEVHDHLSQCPICNAEYIAFLNVVDEVDGD